MDSHLVEIASGRTNHLIDPTLHIWGWEIPVYLFLGGIVAGLMVLLAVLELRSPDRRRSAATQLMPLVGAGLLSLGMLALLLDLEYPTHVYRFYLAFKVTSPMSWGSWILLGVYPALVLMSAGSLSPSLRETALSLAGLLRRSLQWLFSLADAWRTPVVWATLVLGIGLGTYTGLLLGTMAARLQWSSALLGPLFLTSGISTGAAFLMLFPVDHEEHGRLVRWDTIAIAVELGLIALLLVGWSNSGAASKVAADNLLGGPWTPWFWSLVVVMGLAVPLSLNLVEVRRRLAPTFAAPVLVLLGGLALRWVLVLAGQETSFALLQ